MNYVLSLKHTNKTDSYITLWRPKNGGYCWALQNAGLYEDPKIGYHDSCNDVPIKTDDLERLAIEVSIERNGKIVSVIPNCKAIWDTLGLVWKKGNLTRKNYHETIPKTSQEREA